MRRLALAFVVLLVAVGPALGDDVTKKHQVDAKISTLQERLAAHRRREAALRGEVATFTSRIRALEGQVGDVSLHLRTLEDDLRLHQRRLDALDALFRLQSSRYVLLRRQYTSSLQILTRRLVDIYESGRASTLDVFLGSASVQEALDKVAYLTDIGVEDRRIADEVGRAKADVAAARLKTKAIRTTVQGETAVISARAAQARDVRDQLVGATGDLASTKQQTLTDLSQLSAADQAEAGEIDALRAASAAIADRIRAAQAQHATGTPAAAPSSAGLIWPVVGPVTSPFGWRWGRLHEGIDIGAATGTPIRAAAAGTVIYCGWEEGYGNFVVLDHGGNLATAYGHQSQIAVTCGEQVAQGQVIGYVGSTGHSTGPHLHFEVRVDGNPVDPLGYL